MPGGGTRKNTTFSSASSTRYMCVFVEYHSSVNIYSHRYQTGSTAMTRHFKNLLLAPLKQGNQGRDIKLERKNE